LINNGQEEPLIKIDSCQRPAAVIDAPAASNGMEIERGRLTK
jgi:hypothetical protein